MRTPNKKLLAAAAASLLAATTATALGGGSPSAAAPADATGLRVAGLTSDGLTLVRFRAEDPGKILLNRPVTGLTGGDTKAGRHRLPGPGRIPLRRGRQRRERRRLPAQPEQRPCLPGHAADRRPRRRDVRGRLQPGRERAADRQRHRAEPASAFSTSPPPATVADGTLTYPATPTAPATTATGVNGAAYTNNDLDPNTGTTLFDLDTALDQVVIQSPANAGLLAATGKLGFDASGDTGFDIYSRLDVAPVSDSGRMPTDATSQ